MISKKYKKMNSATKTTFTFLTRGAFPQVIA